GRPRPMYEIVGLVKDTKYYDLRDEFGPIVYLTTMQEGEPDQGMQVLIHSSLPLGNLTAAVKSAIVAASPTIVVEFFDLQTLIRDRLMAKLSGGFGALAALLAVLGLYGVISYSVARRTSEIGVRMALGAQRLNIVGMILGEVGWMLAAGLVVGAGLALLLGRS